MTLTPAQVQSRLFDVHQHLAAAADSLKAARDAEVQAEEALTMAKARAILHDDCPKPKRGENGVTVAGRDAWVEQQVQEERFNAKVAEATRKAAEDRLRVVRDQASIVQSLAGLMKAEMSLSGVGA